MNKKWIIVGAAALCLGAALWAADQAKTERFVVPLSNPGKPGKIEVSAFMGSIKVVGYEGKDVVVEASPREKVLGGRTSESLQKYFPGSKSTETQDKAAGLKRIPLDNAGLSAEEENNVVSIETSSFRRAVDLLVKVPFNSSLSLESQGNGSIEVENVRGEIEAENLVGSVTLTNVSGSVTASSMSGGVKVILDKVSPDKPMSFSTMTGDIDVTLPADTKADLVLKNGQGDIYSDFDISLKPTPAPTPQKEGGKFRISIGGATYGTINGGGPEFRFENFNGNIYLRKKK
jgi:hypothetical protein